MEINILGFGTMGKQIAAVMQLLGYQVIVWDRSASEESAAIFSRVLRQIKRRLSMTEMDGSITITRDIHQLRSATTMEFLPDNLEIKKSVLSQLAYDIDTVDFFTNTSSLSPSDISCHAIGLHFFNPVYAIKLVEFSSTNRELTPESKRLIEGLRALDFEIIETRKNKGYIGNYILFHDISAALKLVDLFNYEPSDIDKVLRHLGRTVSLFDIIDLIGVDVTRDIFLNLKEADAAIYISPLLEQAIAANILGIKNGTSIRSLIA